MFDTLNNQSKKKTKKNIKESKQENTMQYRDKEKEINTLHNYMSVFSLIIVSLSSSSIKGEKIQLYDNNLCV